MTVAQALYNMSLLINHQTIKDGVQCTPTLVHKKIV